MADQDQVEGHPGPRADDLSIMRGEAEHTPGPWLWQQTDDGAYCVWTRQPHTGDLATVHPEDINGDYPARANAILMAAAPDLLAACKEYLRWCEKSINAGPVGNPNTHRWHNDQIRAAITKATQP